MNDLLYFGYQPDSLSMRSEFRQEIENAIPNAIYDDVDDPIKGSQISATFPNEETDNYYSWLIAHGWFEASLDMQLMMMDKTRREDFDRVFELSQSQYPECFKEREDED